MKRMILILAWCKSIWVKFISLSKVEKILKGSLDSISSPSPSVKIQIMGGKVCLRCKGKTLLGIVNKLFVFKSLLKTSSNVLPLHLSRPWFEFSLKGKVMGSNPGYLHKSFFTLVVTILWKPSLFASRIEDNTGTKSNNRLFLWKIHIGGLIPNRHNYSCLHDGIVY